MTISSHHLWVATFSPLGTAPMYSPRGRLRHYSLETKSRASSAPHSSLGPRPRLNTPLMQNPWAARTTAADVASLPPVATCCSGAVIAMTPCPTTRLIAATFAAFNVLLANSTNQSLPTASVVASPSPNTSVRRVGFTTTTTLRGRSTATNAASAGPVGKPTSSIAQPADAAMATPSETRTSASLAPSTATAPSATSISSRRRCPPSSSRAAANPSTPTVSPRTTSFAAAPRPRPCTPSQSVTTLPRPNPPTGPPSSSGPSTPFESMALPALSSTAAGSVSPMTPAANPPSVTNTMARPSFSTSAAAPPTGSSTTWWRSEAASSPTPPPTASTPRGTQAAGGPTAPPSHAIQPTRWATTAKPSNSSMPPNDLTEWTAGTSGMTTASTSAMDRTSTTIHTTCCWRRHRWGETATSSSALSVSVGSSRPPSTSRPGRI
mmetsp:Transcript_45583/g.98725  ORF Transcript_45583/g.98725 Transcript_45583/m.98725 type:complete len:436 (+) Transcript_45583:701-2008(+)